MLLDSIVLLVRINYLSTLDKYIEIAIWSVKICTLDLIWMLKHTLITSLKIYIKIESSSRMFDLKKTDNFIYKVVTT